MSPEVILLFSGYKRPINLNLPGYDIMTGDWFALKSLNNKFLQNCIELERTMVDNKILFASIDRLDSLMMISNLLKKH